MILGVIFDFDNTIYDYDACNNKSLLKIFTYIEENFKKEDVKEIYKKINNDIKHSNNYCNKFNKNIYFKRLLESLNIPISELDNILKIYNDEFDINLLISIYPNIEDLLKFLKKDNIKIGILSNNNFKQQYDKLVKLNLISYIDFIQTSDENGYEKPHISMFHSIINKMKIPAENILMIGDNYEHDIEPALKLGLIPFLFKKDDKNINIENKKFFQFSNYNELIIFYMEYTHTENELIYISKLFGQSIINIQGQGGNISIKTTTPTQTSTNKLLLIKSSGAILGNIDKNSGFCIVDNNGCLNLLKNNSTTPLSSTKVFGSKVPSMETYFHCFMKKYTIHIHFTLSNKFLCCNKLNILDSLELKHKIIDYYAPGLVLAQKIYEEYDEEVDLYFLKNHGLIITNNSLTELINLYKKVLYYFNYLLNHEYTDEIITFNINEIIYHKFNKSIVCRYYNNTKNEYKTNINNDIKYCFPDLAVYFQKIYKIECLEDINNFVNIPDLIIYNNNYILIGEILSKLYCMIETMDKYIDLCEDYENLISIDNIYIQNMEQEKYRKNN
jgi:putative hydrolase of the HAD superfamily